MHSAELKTNGNNVSSQVCKQSWDGNEEMMVFQSRRQSCEKREKESKKSCSLRSSIPEKSVVLRRYTQGELN